MLQGTLDGACAKLGVEAGAGHEGHGRGVDVERDALGCQTGDDGAHLQAHNLLYFVAAQRAEHDDVVHAVEKLGADGLFQHVEHALLRLVEAALALGVALAAQGVETALDVGAAQVGRHDDDGVLKVDGAPLVVGEAAVVEHLQQDVEHVGVGFLYFVEEDDAVRLAAHGFGELSALLVADVSGRRPDEARHAELFLVFAHVDARHEAFVVEEELGQGLGQLGLAHARGAQEDERADGALGVLQAGTAAAHGVGHGADGLVLPDDALVELVLKVNELFALALQHAAHGDARPAANDVGNVVGRHLLAHHGCAALSLLQLVLDAVNLVLQGTHAAVAYLGHAAIVALALGPLGLEAELLDLLLVLLYLAHELAFALPLGPQVFLLFGQSGNLLVELFELGLVVLALDGLALDLELAQAARRFVELLGLRVALHA